MQKLWIGLGALAGVTAVAMAAAAAHGLPQRLEPAAMQMVRNGVQMHGWHALALVLCGVWSSRGGTLADLAGAAFTLGLLLFCGAVYALGVWGTRVPGMAPAGGFLLMAGWVLLGVSAVVAD